MRYCDTGSPLDRYRPRGHIVVAIQSPVTITTAVVTAKVKITEGFQAVSILVTLPKKTIDTE
jgi:hypothetical protein